MFLLDRDLATLKTAQPVIPWTIILLTNDSDITYMGDRPI